MPEHPGVTVERGRGVFCFVCDKAAGSGHPVAVGVVCEDCWKAALPEATARLCGRIQGLLVALHQVSASVVLQAVEAALPDTEDRLRVWFELGIRGLVPNGQQGRRTLKLLALIHGLRCAGVSLSLRGSPVHGECGQCSEIRELRGRRKGIPLCGDCWSEWPALLRPCSRCDDVDYHSSPGPPRLCRECRFHDKIRDVFNEDLLRKQPSLAGARDTILSADTTHWSRFFAGVTTWPLLKGMLSEGPPITHESLDSWGTPDQIKILRAFLVTTGALPSRDERLAALESWIGEAAEQIDCEEDRRSFIRFARWRHLRQARQKSLTESQLAWRRRELTLVARFLRSLHAHGLSLQAATQTHLEVWLSEGTKDRKRIRPFLQWCRANAITRTGYIPTLPAAPTPKTSGLGEDRRQELLREVLDPTTDLDQGLRVAAGLMLLYGTRPHELARLQLRDFIAGDGAMHVRFGAVPLQLPEALAIHARAALDSRSVARFGGFNDDYEWLFPGPIHGRPITTSTLIRRLRAIGLKPAPARSTAMGQLAMQLPPVILARLTGITVERAAIWHAATSASQARNLPVGTGPTYAPLVEERDSDAAKGLGCGSD